MGHRTPTGAAAAEAAAPTDAFPELERWRRTLWRRLTVLLAFGHVAGPLTFFLLHGTLWSGAGRLLAVAVGFVALRFLPGEGWAWRYRGLVAGAAASVILAVGQTGLGATAGAAFAMLCVAAALLLAPVEAWLAAGGVCLCILGLGLTGHAVVEPELAVLLASDRWTGWATGAIAPILLGVALLYGTRRLSATVRRARRAMDRERWLVERALERRTVAHQARLARQADLRRPHRLRSLHDLSRGLVLGFREAVDVASDWLDRVETAPHLRGEAVQAIQAAFEQPLRGTDGLVDSRRVGSRHDLGAEGSVGARYQLADVLGAMVEDVAAALPPDVALDWSGARATAWTEVEPSTLRHAVLCLVQVARARGARHIELGAVDIGGARVAVELLHDGRVDGSVRTPAALSWDALDLQVAEALVEEFGGELVTVVSGRTSYPHGVQLVLPPEGREETRSMDSMAASGPPSTVGASVEATAPAVVGFALVGGGIHLVSGPRYPGLAYGMLLLCTIAVGLVERIGSRRPEVVGWVRMGACYLAGGTLLSYGGCGDGLGPIVLLLGLLWGALLVRDPRAPMVAFFGMVGTYLAAAGVFLLAPDDRRSVADLGDPSVWGHRTRDLAMVGAALVMSVQWAHASLRSGLARAAGALRERRRLDREQRAERAHLESMEAEITRLERDRAASPLQGGLGHVVRNALQVVLGIDGIDPDEPAVNAELVADARAALAQAADALVAEPTSGEEAGPGSERAPEPALAAGGTWSG